MSQVNIWGMSLYIKWGRGLFIVVILCTQTLSQVSKGIFPGGWHGNWRVAKRRGALRRVAERRGASRCVAKRRDASRKPDRAHCKVLRRALARREAS